VRASEPHPRSFAVDSSASQLLTLVTRHKVFVHRACTGLTSQPLVAHPAAELRHSPGGQRKDRLRGEHARPITRGSRRRAVVASLEECYAFRCCFHARCCCCPRFCCASFRRQVACAAQRHPSVYAVHETGGQSMSDHSSADRPAAGLQHTPPLTVCQADRLAYTPVGLRLLRGSFCGGA
jgi:hypothetical protein